MIDRLIDRAHLFLINNIYTYIRDYYEYNYNGFITKVNKNLSLNFKDDELGDIIILLNDIRKLTYSNKNKNEVKQND